MNIKILDSWLRDFVKTKASAKEIAEKLSLSSVSVERLEKYKDDYIYDVEVTTNRPDQMSVTGLARETAAVLKQAGIEAKFVAPNPIKPTTPKEKLIEVKNDPKLVDRICAVVMEVKIKDSPAFLKERLETSGIRSLNNLIDITNYVMRVIGHPTHVFDFDRLGSRVLTIREAKLGERIKTLDDKEHRLQGGEIVAVNDKNEIVDLLGIMGLKNSVVDENTKRILFFIDNNEKNRIRKASMNLGIRTEAAILSEKGIDPETSMEALLYGIKLYEDLAGGKVISEIIDIYEKPVKEKTLEVRSEKINQVIGIEIPLKKASSILSDLGFKNEVLKDKLKVTVPTLRINDIDIEEDLIEEIARIFGYQNVPNRLPPLEGGAKSVINEFYWEQRVKEAMKYWGFVETYTYSFVSEDMFEGPIDEAVTLSNPLTEDFVYMRNTLIPSLLKVVTENKEFETVKIFEISNIYLKRADDLPNEVLTFSGIYKKQNVNFYEVKGIIEQLLLDLGIKNVNFKASEKGSMGASVYIDKEYLGEIEALDIHLINFELNFEIILKHANNKKVFKPFAKYPPVVEDITVVAPENIKTEDIIEDIKSQDKIISKVSLKDTFKDSRTFHLVYLDEDKNLTKQDITPIREKIISSLENNFQAKIK